MKENIYRSTMAESVEILKLLAIMNEKIDGVTKEMVQMKARIDKIESHEPEKIVEVRDSVSTKRIKDTMQCAMPKLRNKIYEINKFATENHFCFHIDEDLCNIPEFQEDASIDAHFTVQIPWKNGMIIKITNEIDGFASLWMTDKLSGKRFLTIDCNTVNFHQWCPAVPIDLNNLVSFMMNTQPWCIVLSNMIIWESEDASIRLYIGRIPDSSVWKLKYTFNSKTMEWTAGFDPKLTLMENVEKTFAMMVKE